MKYDVIIVGGGPAGLSAATVLGRCLRRVVLVDAGRPRNSSSRAMHCYLSRDGIDPKVFLTECRAQLRPYRNVQIIDGVVDDAWRDDLGFSVRLEQGGDCLSARKLLFATGVVDRVPAIDGIEQFYGVSVHHCPFCDGWEHRDTPIAVYGRGVKGAGLALMMRVWSSDITLVTDGPGDLDSELTGRLRAGGVRWVETPIAACKGSAAQIEAIILDDASEIPCSALFFNTGQHQRSPLLEKLDVGFTAAGGVRTSATEETRVRGLFVAGDASRDLQLVTVAAAEGATAAIAINRELMDEDGLLISS